MLKIFKVENGLKGEIIIPGDKSISHRSIIIPAISKGVSEISNLLKSDDVINTLNAFKLMGVKIEEENKKIIIYGNGLSSLKKPNKIIYLGNSGTSARLILGILASQNFKSSISGDQSLSSRPMNRIIDPLKTMNAEIDSSDNKMPIKINGKDLQPIKYTIPIPSAQVKSGLILAALNTNGTSHIVEKNITRDHTEIMLEAFGANIEVNHKNNIKNITVSGKHEMISKNIDVPSDLSSSAFFIVAALINKNSHLLLKNININPTRDGILRALKKMNANIKILNKRLKNNEIIADLEVTSSELIGCELNESMAELMIDEYPILSVAAAFANSPSIFKGLKELRIKESNRLELIKFNLQQCGVNCEVKKDDLFIYPSKSYKIRNNKIKTNFDHRIAMSFAIMGSMLNHEIEIEENECIKTSFPSFIKIFKKIGGNLIE